MSFRPSTSLAPYVRCPSPLPTLRRRSCRPSCEHTSPFSHPSTHTHPPTHTLSDDLVGAFTALADTPKGNLKTLCRVAMDRKQQSPTVWSADVAKAFGKCLKAYRAAGMGDADTRDDVVGASLLASLEKDYVQDIFNDFDKDESGRIDAEEFQAVAYELGEALDDGEVDIIFERLDTDGNGVSIDTFRNWINGVQVAESESKEGGGGGRGAAEMRVDSTSSDWQEAARLRAIRAKLYNRQALR